LGKESKDHGDELYKIYREKYGDELVRVNAPSIEGTHVLGKFWKVEDLEDVLQNAMEAEKLAETIYRKLAEETDSEELKKVYLYLADVEKGHYERLRALYEWRKKKGLL
ncbi:ferritin family protein, partial [Thermococcus sp.]